MVERFHPPESPRQVMEDSLRREAYKILANSEDPLAREVAEKILELLDIKKHIEQIRQGADQTQCYQKMKQLGIFWIREHSANFDWKDPKGAFTINKGDKYLDLHLPPLSEDKKTFAEIRRSFQLVAEYIQVQNLHPKYLIGITYEKLGRLATRYGFTVVAPKLPPDVTRGVENVYRNFRSVGGDSENIGSIVICYQETDQFVKRFGEDPLSHVLRGALLGIARSRKTKSELHS